MATLARIMVQILDEQGLVEVRGGEGISPGVLPDVPSHIRRGATVRLRVHASAVTGVSGIHETLEVQGRVTSLEGPRAASGARCRAGLVFKVDVQEVRPSAPGEGLPLPAGAPAAPAFAEIDDDELPTMAMPPQSLSGIFQSARVKGIWDSSGPMSPAPSAFQSPLAPPASVGLRLDLGPEPIAHEDEPNLHSKPPLPPELDASPEPAASSEVLSLVEDTEPSGLFGTLREMPLVELLQSLEMSRKTAGVVLRPKDGPAGEVFVDHGRVIYARAGELLGEDAFFALARARRGAFRVRFHAAPPEQNIDSPTAYLVLEAHRRLDEEGRDAMLVAENAPAAPTEMMPPPVAPPYEEDDDVEENPALLDSTLADQPPADTGEGAPSLDVSLAFQAVQIEDDAPTASERPYPSPRSDRTLDDQPPAPDVVPPSVEARAPTHARLFSHFFEEASGDSEDEEDDPARRDDDEHDPSLRFRAEARTGL